MLPAHRAQNIRQQVVFYLQSTFDFRDRDVERPITHPPLTDGTAAATPASAPTR